jgi:hypothetical protein
MGGRESEERGKCNNNKTEEERRKRRDREKKDTGKKEREICKEWKETWLISTIKKFHRKKKRKRRSMQHFLKIYLFS